MGANEFAEWIAYHAVESNPMLYAETREVPKVQTPDQMISVAKMMSGWFRG